MRWIRGWASVAQSANSFVKRRTAILAACGSGLALACGFRAWRCERTPSPSDLASYVGHVLELLAACRGTRWLRVDRAHVDQAVADVIPRLGSAGAWSAAASSHLHRGLQLWLYEVP